MIQPAGHHLAELNVGRLLASRDDPAVSGFMDNIERINSLGKRSDGFVWMMEGDDPAAGNTETFLDGDEQYITNLTVWRDVKSLEQFVWNTVHRQFYGKREQWFEVMKPAHFVMWWVEQGHQPNLDEAMERLGYLREHGPSDRAFGWADLAEAKLWREKNCRETAA